MSATTPPRRRAMVGLVQPAWALLAAIATADLRAILAIANLVPVKPHRKQAIGRRGLRRIYLTDGIRGVRSKFASLSPGPRRANLRVSWKKRDSSAAGRALSWPRARRKSAMRSGNALAR